MYNNYNLKNEKNLIINHKNEIISLDSIPNGIAQIIYNPELTILYANDYFYNILGINRQSEITNIGLKEFIYKNDMNKILKAIVIQRENNDCITCEFRIINKNNNNIIWLLMHADLNKCLENNEYMTILNCSVTDITDYKNNLKNLEIEKERYKIIYDISDDIIFEYNIENDELKFSEKYKKIFNKETLIQNATKKIKTCSMLYRDDIKLVSNFFKNVIENNKNEQIEIRLKAKNNIYKWFMLTSSILYNSNNNPIKLIGKLHNIDTQKKEKNKLIEKTQIDTLTKLLNRAATEKFIDDYLKTSSINSISALMIIDVDGFKQVNDTYGHLLGDAVLMDIADKIKKVFRKNDIMGRFGGDEFVVFMKDMSNEEAINKKAHELCSEIRNIYSNEVSEQKISISVGISITPKINSSSRTYKSLFENADIALYIAKEKGKDRFEIYNEKFHHKDKIKAEIENESNINIKSELEIKISELLNKQDNIEENINKALKKIGLSFKSDRVYIYCLSNDERFVNYKYQWCDENIKKITDEMNELPVSSECGFNYFEYFKNDIFYCSNIDNLKSPFCEYFKYIDVKSLLQCCMNQNGKFIGFIGIDNCNNKRLFSKTDISLFKSLSNIIGEFLYRTYSWHF